VLPSPESQPTVTVEEAGDALGISRASAYEGVKTGEIPSIRVGRRIVVPTAALRRLLGIDDG
jgi:excisionase family DNA binding protein